MSQHHFRRLLIGSGSLPEAARVALERSLRLAGTQAARVALLQADVEVAALVDLRAEEVAALRAAPLAPAA